MTKKDSFFDIASKIFWILILLILVMSILRLDFGIFRTQEVAEEMVLMDSISKKLDVDTAQAIIDTTKGTDWATYKWAWQSFDGKKYTLSFKVDKQQIKQAIVNRSTSKNYSSALYEELYTFDRKVLSNMIDGYKKIIKENQLNYYSALDMVATSIQSIPYTLVLNSQGYKYKGEWVKCPCQTTFGFFNASCTPLPDGNGCCNDVDPFGVYSPVEFATQKTGDCDTRSLFAFTILKAMGYEVAVMGSDNELHSVLGVKVPGVPGDGIRGSDALAREYYLWELTSYGHRLGTNVKGNDWEVELN